MKMKRLLSFFVITAMLIGIVPSNLVFAEGEEARIGDTQYQTLEEAFTAAAEMDNWNGNPVSRENPVEIDLNTDIELSDTILPDDGGYWSKKEVTWHVKLDGNSHTVKRADGFKDAMIHVAQSSTLYLENITLDGKSDEQVSDSILCIGSTGWFQSSPPQKTHDNYVDIGANTVLQNNYSKYQGGAVELYSGQLFLNGGTIKNNRSDQHGGGVYISDGEEGKNAPEGEENKFYPAVFTMNSGEISGNMAVKRYTYGGGVYVSSISQDEFENGTNSSGFIMNGGSIINNSAYDGGAVSMSNYENVQILGGTISENICCDESGTPNIGVTGILCNFGSSPKIGGKVTITDQISISDYDTASGSKHGRVIVVKDLDTGNSPLPLRIDTYNENCPDGTVLAEKGDGYSGELRLSDFEWKYDSSGYENTSRMLVTSSDGSQIIAGTLKTAVQSGSVDLTYGYGVKLGELDLTGCEIYDENGENKLEGSWSITYGENESAETVPAIGSYTINAVFTPNDNSYKNVNVKFNLNVTKLTPVYTAPQGLTAVYGQTLADVSLPEAENGVWSWADSTLSVGNVGTNTFKAVFTPTDTSIYNTVEDIEVTVMVSRADSGEVVFPAASSLVYGQKLSESALSGGTGNGTFAWSDGETVPTVINSGYEVVFTPNNADSYDYSKVEGYDEETGTVKRIVSVEVTKANPSYTVPQGLTAVYGQTLADVKLPEAENGAWSWSDSTVSVGNVGTNTFKAVFTPADTNNYNTIENIDVAVTVSRADSGEVVFPAASSLVYGQKLSESTLSGGTGNGTFAWSDGETVPTVINSGYEVVFTPNNADSYDYSKVEGYDAATGTVKRIVSVEVSKANPSYTVPQGLTAVYGQTLADVSLPEAENGVWSWADSTLSVGNVGTNTFKAVFTPADTDNYNILEIDITVSVAPAAAGGLDTPTLGEITYDPSVTLEKITLPSGWSWADPTAVPSVENTGYTAYYAVTDADTTDWSKIEGYDPQNKRVARTVALTVKPAVPIVAEIPVTGRGRRGQMLSTLSISKGVVNGLDGNALDGTWTWKTDELLDSIGTRPRTAVFTPESKNYTTVEAEIEVEVNTSGSSAGTTQLTHYTVSFNTMGGSSIASVRVKANSTVERPDDPTRRGYEFDGWYTDRSCTDRYRFSTKVTKSMTLYAKWIEEDAEETPKPTSTPKPTETPKPGTTPQPGWSNPFIDVQSSHWYYDAVKFVNQNGIMQGTESNRFSPELETSRGMIITMLWRMEGQPNVTNSRFADVPADSYYARAIAWGSVNGIVQGYDDGLYRPDQNISRQELAAILYRYAQYAGKSVSQWRDLSGFADADSVSGWAVNYMSWAVGAGLIQGTDQNRLEPLSGATRAAAAAMLQRFLQN